jgi:hypothetical protein
MCAHVCVSGCLARHLLTQMAADRAALQHLTDPTATCWLGLHLESHVEESPENIHWRWAGSGKKQARPEGLQRYPGRWSSWDGAPPAPASLAPSDGGESCAASTAHMRRGAGAAKAEAGGLNVLWAARGCGHRLPFVCQLPDLQEIRRRQVVPSSIRSPAAGAGALALEVLHPAAATRFFPGPPAGRVAVRAGLFGLPAFGAAVTGRLAYAGTNSMLCTPPPPGSRERKAFQGWVLQRERARERGGVAAVRTPHSSRRVAPATNS